MTIAEIKHLRETEDSVEFKEAKSGTFSIDGSAHATPNKRRRCVLGYCVALANEGGGHLIFGVKEGVPNQIVGSSFAKGRLGPLEQRIYQTLKIRVRFEELYDELGNRVLVIQIPGRVIGRPLEFEGVPLMRVGDSLVKMDNQQLFAILSEREPDFSAGICSGLSPEDLDARAIDNLKRKYASHQENELFLTLTNKQVLSDLGLMVDGKFTYAALILLGTKNALSQFLPQANIRLEWRASAQSIRFDRRAIYEGGYLLELDQIWDEIDRHNTTLQVQRNSHIFPVPAFDEDVIREALNNAVAHRDYCRQSEIVLRQNPHSLTVVSPGGFPNGVSLENLLRVASTPRNRLITEVLAKIGEVERSGQGIDLIFYRSLSKAKGAPDYSRSDNYQVEVILPGVVKDEAFAAFINQIQYGRPSTNKLSLEDIIVLEKIRTGEDHRKLNGDVLRHLLDEGLVEKRGKTRATHYRLSKEYYVFADKKGQYTLNNDIPYQQVAVLVINHIGEFGPCRMSDFVSLLSTIMPELKIKKTIYKLRDIGVIDATGSRRWTRYKIGKKLSDETKIRSRALELGLEKMAELGEIIHKAP